MSKEDTKHVSRREFLRLAGIGVGAGVLAACAGQAPAAPTKAAAVVQRTNTWIRSARGIISVRLGTPNLTCFTARSTLRSARKRRRRRKPPLRAS